MLLRSHHVVVHRIRNRMVRHTHHLLILLQVRETLSRASIRVVLPPTLTLRSAALFTLLVNQAAWLSKVGVSSLGLISIVHFGIESSLLLVIAIFIRLHFKNE